MADIILLDGQNPFLELNAQKYLDQLSKTSGLTNNEIEWVGPLVHITVGIFRYESHN